MISALRVRKPLNSRHTLSVDALRSPLALEASEPECLVESIDYDIDYGCGDRMRTGTLNRPTVNHLSLRSQTDRLPFAAIERTGLTRHAGRMCGATAASLRQAALNLGYHLPMEEPLSRIPGFDRYVGIDYSDAETPTSSLRGLRVYMADQTVPPVDVRPPPSPRKYWTRRGIA